MMLKKIWKWLSENMVFGNGVEHQARLGFLEYQCKLIKSERELQEKKDRESDKPETHSTKHIK